MNKWVNGPMNKLINEQNDNSVWPKTQLFCNLKYLCQYLLLVYTLFWCESYQIPDLNRPFTSLLVWIICTEVPFLKGSHNLKKECL